MPRPRESGLGSRLRRPPKSRPQVLKKRKVGRRRKKARPLREPLT
jgi:hypothetical protein